MMSPIALRRTINMRITSLLENGKAPLIFSCAQPHFACEIGILLGKFTCLYTATNADLLSPLATDVPHFHLLRNSLESNLGPLERETRVGPCPRNVSGQ